MTHKIKFYGKSRKGNSRLRAIIVVQLEPYTTQQAHQEVNNQIRKIEPDKNGVMWLCVNSPSLVKVYLIK